MFVAPRRFFPARDDDDDDAERTRPPRTDATAHARAMPPARVARGVDRAVVQRALCAFVRARASGARDDDDARASSLLFDAAPPPPTTWGESATRLARVVRLSWSEALARLNIWRLDHVLALRMLSQRDMGGGDRERGGEDAGRARV